MSGRWSRLIVSDFAIYPAEARFIITPKAQKANFGDVARPAAGMIFISAIEGLRYT